MNKIFLFFICIGLINDVYSSETRSLVHRKESLKAYVQSEKFIVDPEAKNNAKILRREALRLSKESSVVAHIQVLESILKEFLGISVEIKTCERNSRVSSIQKTLHKLYSNNDSSKPCIDDGMVSKNNGRLAALATSVDHADFVAPAVVAAPVATLMNSILNRRRVQSYFPDPLQPLDSKLTNTLPYALMFSIAKFVEEDKKKNSSYYR